MRRKGRFFIVSLIIGSLLVISPLFPSASEVPGIIELDGIGDIYGPVTFDHAMHMDVASCSVCHHHTTGLPAEDEKCVQCHKDSDTANAVTCTGCHPVNPVSNKTVRASKNADLFHIDTTGLKRAYHLKCLACHIEMDAPSGCEDCHPKRDDDENVTSTDD